MTGSVHRQRIEPQSGIALTLRRGQTLRVVAPRAEQVCDLVAFGLSDRREWLSSGRTFDYNETTALTTGHTLYSNRSNAMFRIAADTAGRHDFLLAPCSTEMFRMMHGVEGDHPSCLGNLAGALAPFGITPDQIPTAFNIFMDVRILPSGALRVEPPSSRAGDHVDLAVEMDLIAGLTACSAELTNHGSFKPIDVCVFDRDPPD